MEGPAKRKCPACAEEILAEALKCKHCGEVFNPVGVFGDWRKAGGNRALGAMATIICLDLAGCLIAPAKPVDVAYEGAGLAALVDAKDALMAAGPGHVVFPRSQFGPIWGNTATAIVVAPTEAPALTKEYDDWYDSGDSKERIARIYTTGRHPKLVNNSARARTLEELDKEIEAARDAVSRPQNKFTRNMVLSFSGVLAGLVVALYFAIRRPIAARQDTGGTVPGLKRGSRAAAAVFVLAAFVLGYGTVQGIAAELVGRPGGVPALIALATMLPLIVAAFRWFLVSPLVAERGGNSAGKVEPTP